MRRSTFLMFLLIFSILLNIYFFVWKKKDNDINLSSKSNLVSVWPNLNNKKNSEIKTSNKKQKEILLKEALKGKKNFSYFVNKIQEKYNLVNIIIKEFREVKNRGEYFRLRKKFWWDQLLYTFIKIRNIELADKYMNYYLWSDEHKNLGKIENIRDKNKRNLMISDFNKILKEYYKKWYFNELWYINPNWEYDYFRLSLMNYSLYKKIKICKEWFKKEDDFNSCRRVVIYMVANKKNGYCSMLIGNYYKKWCNDTLDYLTKK